MNYEKVLINLAKNLDEYDQNKYLMLENIIYNFSMLKDNNSFLIKKLTKKYNNTSDIKEKNIISNLLKIMNNIDYDNLEELVIKDIYILPKQKANLFIGALNNTSISTLKLLNDKFIQDKIINSLKMLKQQNERLQGIDNYYSYLLGKYNKYKDSISIQDKINRLYYERYLELYKTKKEVLEPIYLYNIKTSLIK